MRKPPTFSELLVCGECRVHTPRIASVQKYCPSCSEKKDLERKRTWARDNPLSPEQHSVKNSIRRNRMALAGAAKSADIRRGMAWLPNCDDDINTLLRVAVPFSWDFSKNRLWSMGARRGHVFMRKECKVTRDSLQLLIEKTLSERGIKFHVGKIWIDILVQKPNMRGDAINVIDSICDAVKKAIEVDDRWFSIRKLDWEIVKTDPMIYVGIGQMIEGQHFICSYCGVSQILDNRAGHKRTCKSCANNRSKDE